MIIAIIIATALLVYCLNHISKQLLIILENMPHSTKQGNKKELSKSTMDSVEEDCAKEWLSKVTFHDYLDVNGECDGINFKSRDLRTNPKSKDGEKDITILFTGAAKGYFGYLPTHENICKANIFVTFGKKDKFADSRVFLLNQMRENAMEELENVDGLHEFCIEIYEDISEYEKYKPIIASGKTLKITAQVDAYTQKDKNSKIKQSDKTIEDVYGFVSSYTIYG